jgi:hypothetical protein
MRRWAADQITLQQAAEPSAHIVEWLRSLRSLRGVPLGYLVPDTRMLPEESLRFFAVDANWLDALCDGALSLRSSGRADALLREAALRRATAREPDLTGFLLRSVAVWRWPDIQVEGFVSDSPAKLVAHDRPAPDVLLAIFRGQLHQVVLSEPVRTVHFASRGDLPIPRDEHGVVDVKRLHEAAQAPDSARLATRLTVNAAARVRFSAIKGPDG